MGVKGSSKDYSKGNGACVCGGSAFWVFVCVFYLLGCGIEDSRL